MDSKDIESLIALAALKYVGQLDNLGVIKKNEAFEGWLRSLYYKIDKAGLVFDKLQEEQAASS